MMEIERIHADDLNIGDRVLYEIDGGIDADAATVDAYKASIGASGVGVVREIDAINDHIMVEFAGNTRITLLATSLAKEAEGG